MSGAEADPNPDCQNLSDIQNYLVSFNKEIEGGEQPHFQAATLTQIPHPETNPEEVAETSADKEPETVNYDTVYYDGQPLLQHSEEQNGADVPVSLPIQGFVVASAAEAEAAMNPETSGILEESNVVKEDILDAAEQLSAVHAQIAELSGSSEVHVGTDFETVAEQGSISQAGVEVPEDVITTSTSVSEHTVQMVAPDGQHAVQMGEGNVTVDISQFSEETLQSGEDDVSQATQEQIQQIVQGETIMDGSDPVAVLASVAANSSSALGSLQSVTVSQPELHGAHLVALQSSDSSQPQLVAVQAPDGSGTENIQVMGTSEVSTLPNGQVILNTPGNSYQTVTIMPSELNQGGEVSYVLIVSQPEGEREGSTRGMGVDMSVYDFTRDDTREVIEEIIDEHGTARKIIRLKKPGSPTSPSQLMCHYCNYTSPKRYLLTRHMKSHSQERPHKCGICSRGFKTLASLQNHVNTHTGLRPHKCRQCESSFTTSGELVRHVRYRHSFEKPHKCTECDYASVELSKLKRHMRSHTGERPYHCPHCPYASPDAYKLKRHLRIHTGEKPYECDICQSRFTQSNSLKAHRLIHSGNKPVFQCELCPTTCGRKTDLKIHMQKLHTAEEPLQCERCLQTFPDRYQFKVHVRTHEGEKCYKCDKCEYAALSKRHLDSHMLTHSGEKPYECDGCGQSFRQKQLLKRHKNLYHTPEYIAPSPKNKLFYCAECDRSFAHKGNLMRHMALHDPDSHICKVFQTTEGPSTEMLQRNIRAELQEGRLTNPAGKTPQVVIVHLDGHVEEINPDDPVEDPMEEDPSEVEDKSTDNMVDLAVQTYQNTVTEVNTSAEDMGQLPVNSKVKVVRVGGKGNPYVSEDEGVRTITDVSVAGESIVDQSIPDQPLTGPSENSSITETTPDSVNGPPKSVPSVHVLQETVPSASVPQVTAPSEEEELHLDENQVCQEAGTQVEFESEEEDSTPEAPKNRKTESSHKGVSFTIQEVSDGTQRTYVPLKKVKKHYKSYAGSRSDRGAQKFPTASKSAASLLNTLPQEEPSEPEMKATEVQTSEPIESVVDESTADQESSALEAQETTSEDTTAVEMSPAEMTAVEMSAVKRTVVETISEATTAVEPSPAVESVTEPSQSVGRESTTLNAVPETAEESMPALSQGEKGEEAPTPRRRGRPPKKKVEECVDSHVKGEKPEVQTTPSSTPILPPRGRMTTRSSPKGVVSPVTASPKPDSQEDKSLRARKRKADIEVSSPKRSRRLENAAKQAGLTGKK
ncbi:RE1-silencing transcription factor-like isoform X2 [Liolophura sinensis]|uniref:RE1-silencing transcription factor-like isoform X2 n=1 Tax=Liolophura sinensis TaxID=3198878 RepID=UPI0031596491